MYLFKLCNTYTTLKYFQYLFNNITHKKQWVFPYQTYTVNTKKKKRSLVPKQT